MIAVLGLDQSFGAIGHALVVNQIVLNSGVIKYGRAPAIEKLPQILKDVGELMCESEDDSGCDTFALALEQSWLGENFQTASKLSELRGALVGLAIGRGWDVHRVDPRTWHASSGILIRADRKTVKRESVAVAALRLKSPGEKLPDDQADAINIAFHVAGVLRMRGKAA